MGHVTNMSVIRNVSEMLVGKHEGKKYLLGDVGIEGG
jgi:hypothetical protein